MRVVVLGGLYALLFGQVIRAQSPQHKPKTCVPSPCPSSDAFEEMTGKKIYPKMIVDDVKFDGPAHLPDSNEEREVISQLKQHMFDRGSEGLDEVLEVGIRYAWQDQGYFKVMATGQTQIVSSDSAYEHVVVTIHVTPGQQYWLGESGISREQPRPAPRLYDRRVAEANSAAGRGRFQRYQNQGESRCVEEALRLPWIHQSCCDARNRRRRFNSACLADHGTRRRHAVQSSEGRGIWYQAQQGGDADVEGEARGSFPIQRRGSIRKREPTWVLRRDIK
jgi:hypothetical protein